MNITTEQKENCVIDLHITLPPERFDQEWKRIEDEYCRLADLKSELKNLNLRKRN